MTAKSINEVNRKAAMDRMEAAGALPERVKTERAISDGTYCKFLGEGAGSVRTTCRNVKASAFKCSHETVNVQFCSCIISVPRKRATEIILLDGTETKVKGDLTEYVAVCDQCEHRETPNGKPIKPAEKSPQLPRPTDGRSLRDEVNQFVLDSMPRGMAVGEASKFAVALERFAKRIIAENDNRKG